MAYMTESDLRSTLNLPQTDFPMKANLPQAEPKRLELGGGGPLRAGPRGARRARRASCSTTARPTPTATSTSGTALNKILKDLVVRSRSMAGYDAPYVPGWDCHGLPIELKVDKRARREEERDVAGRRSARRAARTPRSSSTSSARSSSGSASSATGTTPTSRWRPRYEATIVRQLAIRREGPRLQGQEVGALVHLVPHRARRGRGRVRREPRQPAIDVRFALADAEARRARRRATRRSRASTCRRRSGRRRRGRCRQPGARLPSRRRLRASTRSRARTRCCWSRRRSEAEARGRSALGGSTASRRAARRGEGRRARGRALPPPLDRPRLARRPRRLRHARHRHRPRAHRARPRPGRLPDRRQATASTSTARSTRAAASCPRSSASPASSVFEANPRDRRASCASKGALVQAGKDKHSYPLCWRCKNPIIFRATEQWFIALDEGSPTLREQALAAIAASRWLPGLGRGAHPQHDRDAPRLVHLAPAPVGRADPGLLLRGLRRGAAATPTCARTSPTSSRRRAPTPGTRARRRTCCPRASPARSAAARSSTRRRTSSTSGSTPAPRTRRCSSTRPDLPWPADLYLEGSDQHRGWFHSSLLIGVGTRGARALPAGDHPRLHPRRRGQEDVEVPRQRRRAQKMIAQLRRRDPAAVGVMVDYREDMRISDEMIKRVAEAYRKVRNTFRFLLANLSDFDPARDAVAEDALDELDRYALARHRQVVARVLEAYDELRVPRRLPPAHQVLRADLSAFYLDVLKDRLYCDAADGPRRRSAQTVLHRIARDLCAAAGAGAALHGRRGLAAAAGRARGVRAPGALPSRASRPTTRCSSAGPACSTCAPRSPRRSRRRAPRSRSRPSLEAAVVVRAPERDARAAASPRRARERLPGQPRQPLHRERGPTSRRARPGSRSTVEHAAGAKCERCWTWSEKRRPLAAHPGVCERCAQVLDASVKRQLAVPAADRRRSCVLDQVTKALVVRSIELHDYRPARRRAAEPQPRAQPRRRLRPPLGRGPAVPVAAVLGR